MRGPGVVLSTCPPPLPPPSHQRHTYKHTYTQTQTYQRCRRIPSVALPPPPSPSIASAFDPADLRSSHGATLAVAGVRMPKGDGRGRDAAVGEGRGGGAESRRRRWRWARGSTRFGKRRARGEAKTLRRSIPSLRATRFRSPAAFMHQERGQRGGGGWARVRGGGVRGRGDASERDAGFPRNYSARRTRGSSQVILALGCRVIYPALLPYLPRLESERDRAKDRERKSE